MKFKFDITDITFVDCTVIIEAPSYLDAQCEYYRTHSMKNRINKITQDKTVETYMFAYRYNVGKGTFTYKIRASDVTIAERKLRSMFMKGVVLDIFERWVIRKNGYGDDSYNRLDSTRV